MGQIIANPRCFLAIDKLGLSPRIANLLQDTGFNIRGETHTLHYALEIALHTDAELLRIPRLGIGSLKQVKRVLEAKTGLHPGMDIDTDDPILRKMTPRQIVDFAIELKEADDLRAFIRTCLSGDNTDIGRRIRGEVGALFKEAGCEIAPGEPLPEVIPEQIKKRLLDALLLARRGGNYLNQRL
jgi:hypothetical protein